MTGRTHGPFWKHFDTLPAVIQKLAREKYALWRRDPFHRSLRFEERRNGICVVRIGDHHRALGIREGEIVGWFWIGTHEEYNRFRFSPVTGFVSRDFEELARIALETERDTVIALRNEETISDEVLRRIQRDIT